MAMILTFFAAGFGQAWGTSHKRWASSLGRDHGTPPSLKRNKRSTQRGRKLNNAVWLKLVVSSPPNGRDHGFKLRQVYQPQTFVSGYQLPYAVRCLAPASHGRKRPFNETVRGSGELDLNMNKDVIKTTAKNKERQNGNVAGYSF